MMKLLTLIILSTFTLLVSGCSAKPDPTYVDIYLNADQTINPTPAQNNAPVVVKIIELKDSKRFESADFFSLYRQAEATLGKTFVAQEELILQPGQQKNFQFQLIDGSANIGILVAYRNQKEGIWRYSITPEQEKQQLIKLQLSKNTIKPILDEE